MPRPSRSSRLVRPTGLVLLAALAQAALILLLAWPAGQARLHGAPLVIAGPQAIAAVARANLEAGSPSTWSISVTEKDADARRAVLERKAYGALVIGNDGLTLVVASAASPTIAQQLLQSVDAIQARAQGTTLAVEDVAPSPKRDPRGTTLAPALLGILVSSAAFGVLVFTRVRRVRERLGAFALFATAAGAGAATVLHTMLGALNGPFVAEAGVLALLAAAAAAAPLVLGAVADLPGAVLAAVLVVPLGYPISGATSAPEFVPAPWDQLGGLLPAGAGHTAVRGVAFFHGQGAGRALLVLGAWAASAILVSTPWSSLLARVRSVTVPSVSASPSQATVTVDV